MVDSRLVEAQGDAQAIRPGSTLGMTSPGCRRQSFSVYSSNESMRTALVVYKHDFIDHFSRLNIILFKRGQINLLNKTLYTGGSRDEPSPFHFI